MYRLSSFSASGLVQATAAALLLTTGAASATPDGPDFFQVTGVAGNDVLNIRAEPDPQANKIGEIPHDETCVRNLGCKGGLTFQEFTELSEEQKAERQKENPRWCQVEYRGLEGWVAGRYLKEGACGTEAADPSASLSHLIGVRGRDGERELRRLGFRYQGGHKTENSSVTFYEEPEGGRCLQVVTRDGRYRSLGYVDDSECRSAATATAIAPGETNLSVKPGSDSFQTLCGVIVDKKTHSYLCRVTEIKGEKGIERTTLRYPDQEIQLIWGKDKQVDVLFEGLANATPATYSTYEGETDLFIEGKTYFYYSDRGMAAMEVKHFKP